MSKSLFEQVDEMMKKFRENNQNLVIVTATQQPREFSGHTPRLDLGSSEFDIIIIDHINLIK